MMDFAFAASGCRVVRGRRRAVRCGFASEREALLLSLVAGTDKGRSLTSKQRKSVEHMVSLLERNFASSLEFPENLKVLDGTWRLVYTSRELPVFTPIGALSSIYQRLETAERKIEYILHFNVLPWSLATTSVSVQARFETLDSCRLRTKVTDVAFGIGAQEHAVSFALPTLALKEILGSNGTEEVETTYLANGVKVNRSAAGEIKIFLHEPW